jgi:hypothetical protein
MAYRNGTYVAFHAEGSTSPIDSDIRYYRMLLAWNEHGGIEFSMNDSHEKGGVIRDSSSRATLENRLKERLRDSKNMLLIIGNTTRFDTDWVPMEICYAVDTCRIPIIAAYTTFNGPIFDPSAFASLWPRALSDRINNGSAAVIHIPFKQEPIKSAIAQFGPERGTLRTGLEHYSSDAYRSFGIAV